MDKSRELFKSSRAQELIRPRLRISNVKNSGIIKVDGVLTGGHGRVGLGGVAAVVSFL